MRESSLMQFQTDEVDGMFAENLSFFNYWIHLLKLGYSDIVSRVIGYYRLEALRSSQANTYSYIYISIYGVAAIKYKKHIYITSLFSARHPWNFLSHFSVELRNLIL